MVCSCIQPAGHTQARVDKSTWIESGAKAPITDWIEERSTGITQFHWYSSSLQTLCASEIRSGQMHWGEIVDLKSWEIHRTLGQPIGNCFFLYLFLKLLTLVRFECGFQSEGVGI